MQTIVDTSTERDYCCTEVKMIDSSYCFSLLRRLCLQIGWWSVKVRGNGALIANECEYFCFKPEEMKIGPRASSCLETRTNLGTLRLDSVASFLHPAFPVFKRTKTYSQSRAALVATRLHSLFVLIGALTFPGKGDLSTRGRNLCRCGRHGKQGGRHGRHWYHLRIITVEMSTTISCR